MARTIPLLCPKLEISQDGVHWEDITPYLVPYCSCPDDREKEVGPHHLDCCPLYSSKPEKENNG